MQVVVPATNPGRVESFTDLADPGLNVVVCAPQVPCGAATVRIERTSGVDISADSEEASATDVLNKIVTGQADAAVVYSSDVVTAPDSVTGIAIPPEINTINRYPIAALDDSGATFVDLVLSEDGRRILRANGFGLP